MTSALHSGGEPRKDYNQPNADEQKTVNSDSGNSIAEPKVASSCCDCVMAYHGRGTHSSGDRRVAILRKAARFTGADFESRIAVECSRQSSRKSISDAVRAARWPPPRQRYAVNTGRGSAGKEVDGTGVESRSRATSNQFLHRALRRVEDENGNELVWRGRL